MFLPTAVKRLAAAAAALLTSATIASAQSLPDALLQAVQDNDAPAVGHLLAAGQDVNATDARG